MEEILSLDLINIRPEYIKLITFIWNIVKCTLLLVINIKLLRWFTNKIYKQVTSKISSNERVQQFGTLKEIVLHAIETVIFAVYLINMLYLFGIDVKPLLATAGILGVAIGFGSKRLVEDIFTGIIILLEGQLRIGDYVEIEGMKGTVEKITLPMITVRSDETGALCFIRCGYINSVKNFTINFAYAFFKFDIAYEQNIDHAFKTIKKAFEILKSNEEYNKLIIGDLEIWGLDEFKDSSLCIKCRIKTKPKGQWTIKRAFNKIIKERFDLENIEIPFNQIVVSNK